MHRSNGVAERKNRQIEPQFNLDAERQLLGSAFRDREVGVHLSKVLTVGHFHSDRHQHVFRSMQSIIMSGGEIDPVTVASELEAMGVLLNVGGAPAVIEIYQSTITAAAWKQKLGIIQEKYGQRRMAAIANNIFLDAESMSGPFEEIAQAYIDQLNDLRREVSGTRDIETFDVMTAQSLDGANLNIEWLIPNVIAKGMHLGIGGPEKSCKTLIAAEAAVSMATGTDFLGCFPGSVECNVLLMSCETVGSVLRDNIRALCRNRRKDGMTVSYRLPEVSRFFLSLTTPNISSIAELQKLRRTIEEHKIEVVIIDPAYLSMGNDLEAGNLFAVGAILRGLGQLAQELGFTVIVCHHANKKIELGEFCQLKHLSWAGWREWLGGWILINAAADFDPDEREHNLLVNLGGRAGHSGKFKLKINEGHYDDPARKILFSIKKAESKKDKQDQQTERKAQERRNKVIEALRKSPEGMTKGAIQAETGFNGVITNNAVESLLFRDVIEPVTIQIKGRDYQGFKLISVRSSTLVNDGPDERGLPNGRSFVSSSTPYKGVTNELDQRSDWQTSATGELEF